MHRSVAKAFDEIDAAVFNGDTFDQTEARTTLVYFVERWLRNFGVDTSKIPTQIEHANAKRALELAGEAIEALFAGFDRGDFEDHHDTGQPYDNGIGNIAGDMVADDCPQDDTCECACREVTSQLSDALNMIKAMVKS